MDGARRWRALRWLVCLAALGCLLWGFVIEPSRLVERHARLSLDQAPGLSLRVALLSDIHAGCNFVDRGRMRELVERVNARQVDLVALLGDYVTENRFATPIPPEVTGEILGKLRARYGVFAVLGNHDWWHDGERVQKAFEQGGIRVLEGEGTTITTERGPVHVFGVPDAKTRAYQVQVAAGKIPAGAPVLALTHSPDVFPDLPDHATLTLAGHTHGGQVALPLLGRPVVPSRYGQRYAYGHVVEGKKHLYVTSGVGMSILPVRFGVPPEIVFLDINPGEAQRPR